MSADTALFCPTCEIQIPVSALTHTVGDEQHGVRPVHLDRPRTLSEGKPDITFDIEYRQTWSTVAGDDPRGYHWSPPGTYVIAQRLDGRHLAEVQINYAMRHAGEGQFPGYIARHIMRALRDAYYPNPVAGNPDAY